MVVPVGHSVLLPCDGSVHQQQQHARKPSKSSPLSVNIRWRGPDGQDIEITDTFRAQFPNGSLYISSLEDNRGLTGKYQCLLSAEGIGTIVSRSARVSLVSEYLNVYVYFVFMIPNIFRILGLPETYSVSSEIYMYPGQTAYFKCLSTSIVDGSGIIIKWFKDEVALRIDESRMTLFTSGSLEIDGVKSTDSGSYQCHISAGTQSK